jgi:REP element-mobilizing transposase RayT
MSDKFKHKYRIETNRLKGFDYGTNATYFVTICTHEKIHYFGDIVETRDCASNHINIEKCSSHKSDEGHEKHDEHEIHNEYDTRNRAYLRATEIGEITTQYWHAIPDHYPFVTLDEFVIMPNHLHGIISIHKEETLSWESNKFGTQSRNLGAIIRGFKSSVKKYANEQNIDFNWQGRFHDHIIRDDAALIAVRNYIIANPDNWQRDKENEQGLKM